MFKNWYLRWCQFRLHVYIQTCNKKQVFDNANYYCNQPSLFSIVIAITTIGSATADRVRI